jgi:hypothetical protein
MTRAGLTPLRAQTCALTFALAWVLCVAPAASLAGPVAAPAQHEELVPAGAWLARLSRGTHTQDRAIGRDNVEAPLLDYLQPDPALRGNLAGAVSRDVERIELTVGYGLSDTWNVQLQVPHVRVTQRSDVSSLSGDPQVQAEVARLGSREVSGLGRARLGSLHRPVFSDRHGFVLGYGLDWPADDPANPWAGRGTLLVDSPVPHWFGLLHYTYYPAGTANRLDIRAEAGFPFDERLTQADGTAASVNDGSTLQLSAGWQQELGPVVLGFGVGGWSQDVSTVAGEGQGDAQVEWSGRIVLGYGNLRELEQGPLTFPYRLLLGYERTLQGFNVPIRNELTLSLQTYF